MAFYLLSISSTTLLLLLLGFEKQGEAGKSDQRLRVESYQDIIEKVGSSIKAAGSPETAKVMKER